MCNNSFRRPMTRISIHPLLSNLLLVTEPTKIPQELQVSVFKFLHFKSSSKYFYIEFNMQRSSPKGSMMTIENTNGMMPVNGQHNNNGFEKYGANSPLLRVGTTITTSTNITTS